MYVFIVLYQSSSFEKWYINFALKLISLFTFSKAGQFRCANPPPPPLRNKATALLHKRTTRGATWCQQQRIIETPTQRAPNNTPAIHSTQNTTTTTREAVTTCTYQGAGAYCHSTVLCAQSEGHIHAWDHSIRVQNDDREQGTKDPLPITEEPPPSSSLAPVGVRRIHALLAISNLWKKWKKTRDGHMQKRTTLSHASVLCLCSLPRSPHFPCLFRLLYQQHSLFSFSSMSTSAVHYLEELTREKHQGWVRWSREWGMGGNGG